MYIRNLFTQGAPWSRLKNSSRNLPAFRKVFFFFIILRKKNCDIENFWILIEDFTLHLWKGLPSKQDNIQYVNRFPETFIARTASQLCHTPYGKDFFQHQFLFPRVICFYFTEQKLSCFREAPSNHARIFVSRRSVFAD